MKFKQYINEKVDTEDIKKAIDTIEKDCKPYLKLIKGRHPFFRLMKGERLHGIDKKKVRKDRISQGIASKILFQRINEWMVKNGHVRRDNCVIVSPDYHTVRNLPFGGNVYTVYPIGNFKYSYIKSPDFNAINMKVNYIPFIWYSLLNPDDIMAAITDKEMLVKDDGDFRELVKMDSGLLDRYVVSNKGISEVYSKNYEIWFECKEYYYTLYDSDVSVHFGGGG